MSGIAYFENAIDKALLKVRTAYLAKVLKVNGNRATVQELDTYKPVGGKASERKPVSALIPPNIKLKEQTITYLVSTEQRESTTVLVPEALGIGDIVVVVVCDRDITNAQNGIISEATNRHHNINDSVIVRYLG